MSLLKKRNVHERDERIWFDEEPHLYYIEGDCENISVTTLVHRYFPKFDPDTVIRRMMSSRNWPNSKYYGKSADDIKKQWSNAGTDATTRGTRMHKAIELFYNEEDVREYSDDPEFAMFQQFVRDHQDKLRPFRTEWEVYDEDHRIAGSIDMVFENLDDGTLSIYDWKRSKEIKTNNPFGGKGFDHMAKHPDCNFVHYSLQLNIYKHILETKYGKVIRDLFLVVMHPDSGSPSYQKFECLGLQPEVQHIFRDRLQCVQRNLLFT